MKILITGAGGMLGSDLVSQLASDHQLVGIGRGGDPHLGIPFHIYNLTSKNSTQELIDREKPEVVLHAAAMTDVDGCENDRREAIANNFEATRNVAEASNRVKALLIFFSTDFVFDGRKSEPYLEEDPPHPINVYGESKLLAERYLFVQSKRFLIVRSAWLFGKQGDNFPKKVLRRIETGKTIQIVSDQMGNPTFTKDLAKGVSEMIRLTARPGTTRINQIYHMVNEGAVSRFDFACEILKRRNLPLSMLQPVLSEAVHHTAERPKNSALSTLKLMKAFGIRLRRWEEGLGEYLRDASLADPALSPERSEI